ncbi:MAG: YebC/PmpR family DNA-binding transcriptional regulator [Phycisphaerales bacterium]|nr:MAG: YebC/PmpR family DNA-binding transcriptional regulator [Phycisphaerales bacterium]
MAGHSKWANIKHRKARQDAVRGKAWSKCSRAIIVAAKNGGGDPDTNLTLRYAIEEAKAVNMPKDTIAKAIKKGSGELAAGESYEEIRYEGYGAGGVAIIVDCLTDKVQRTAPEMRRIFEKAGGNLGKPGAVAFGFNQKGLIAIEADKTTEDQLMEIALEAGAEDITDSDGVWEVTTDVPDFISVKEAIEEAEIEMQSAEITMIPLNTVACDEATAQKVMRLIEELEDHDDVQKVHTNADIPDEVMEKLA